MKQTDTPVEPRKAAAGIILSGGSDPHVLLVRRSIALRFMGGHHAFPGGRIDENEPTGLIVGAPDPDEAAAIHAVAREIFEETGMLLGATGCPPAGELRSLRRRLLAQETNFDQILEEYSLKIDASKFAPAGLWITPRMSPIRFHTRYYLHHLNGERCEELIEGEVDGLEWVRPDVARAQWREGAILLPAPVAYVLHQLEKFRFPDALHHIRRTTHISPAEPGRIEHRNGIYSVALRTPTLPPATTTNCIIVGEQELFIIDPGTPYREEQENLRNQVDHLLEMGGRVAAILLTHSHPDHTGAAQFMRRTYNAPIWAHEKVAPQVDFSIDRFLRDNEVIHAAGRPDWRIRCLYTPGHDPGHLAFLEESTRTLLCGDMVADGSTIVVAPRFGGSMDDYLNSLTRLLTEDFDLMIAAHGWPIHDPKERIRQYIQHRIEREEKVKSTLQRGAANFRELLEKVYDDVPSQALPFAEHSLRAHLIRLGVSLPE